MHRLKKSLGQHFLHDNAVIDKIVAALSKTELKQLLEIGPGGGALTQHLLHLQVDFKAVEIDEDKVVFLLEKFTALQGKVIREDVLNMPIPFSGNFSVIGNFPYNISSPIMFKLYDWQDQVDEVVGMFQKEVGRRIASVHGNKEYGILSVLMQAFFDVEYLFDVHENCFTPPPKVKSGVLRFKNNGNRYGIKNRKAFKQLVKTAFSQRRKTLRNALRSSFEIERLTDSFFDQRAEQLSVSDFVQLHFQLQG